MWNDTDIPLAYLITFRTYGTWLHGDDRGSTDRFRNQYKSPMIAPNPKWERYNMNRLRKEPVFLNAIQRRTVEDGIRETCEIRKWRLNAINVRTNHIHTVISAGTTKPEVVLNALKANATRKMREDGCWKYKNSPWADKGSNRYLWNERSIEIAVDYVVNGQGGQLPEFD